MLLCKGEGIRKTTVHFVIIFFFKSYVLAPFADIERERSDAVTAAMEEASLFPDMFASRENKAQTDSVFGKQKFSH